MQFKVEFGIFFVGLLIRCLNIRLNLVYNSLGSLLFRLPCPDFEQLLGWHGLGLPVKTLQKILILLDSCLLFALGFRLRRLLRNNLCLRHSGHFIEDSGFEPAVGYLQFSFDVLPEEMHIINGHCEFEAHVFIVFTGKHLVLILSNFIPIKTIFQSKTVSYLELFPGDDSRSSNLIWFNPESTIFVIEHVGFLSKDAGQ